MALIDFIVGDAVKNVLKSPQWKRFITTASKINVRIGDHQFKTSDYFKIRDILKANPGAVYGFVCAEKNRASYHLERISLGSVFSHAGLIVVGDATADDVTCLHIDNRGLVVEHILDVVDKCDKFAIIKLPISERNLPKAHERILTAIENKSKYVYDTEFDLNNDKAEDPKNELRILSYCSELCLDICDGLVDDPDFKPKLKLGVKFFSPDDFLKCGELVYSN